MKLTETHIADLAELQRLCTELQSDLVIVGAIAYQYHFPEEDRHTRDIDSAVALDLEDFKEMKQRLLSMGWRNEENHEERWISQNETRIDLIPAGVNLRQEKRITWPQSQFTMSLVGFDHVFSEAQLVTFGDGLAIKVIPPVVLMLLKVVAFMDDQERRSKDLLDIRALMSIYEASSGRIFSDEVFDADLEDFSLVNAYLLGRDLKALCNQEEADVVRNFLSALNDDSKPAWVRFIEAGLRHSERTEKIAQLQVEAFQKGFES